MGNDKKTNSNRFMRDWITNPKEIINTTAFAIGSSAIQFFALLFFAVIGASISFKFENLVDVLNYDYWVSVVVLMIEQLYSYNIGYDLGRTMTINGNKELNTIKEQIEALVEGVYENDKEIVRALKKDSAYIDNILDELMNEEKIRLVKNRMKEIIQIFKSHLDYYKSLKKKKYFLPKKIVISKRQKKRFWNIEKAILYCETQIENGQEMLDNDNVILAVPDKNVKGFQRITYADIISTQNEKIANETSKYYQESETQVKAKNYGKKAITKIGLSMIGPAILFGALFGDAGAVIYSIFVLVLNLMGGFKFGSQMVINVILRNAVNRLKAIKDIQARLPKQETKKEEIKEIATTEIATTPIL